MSTTDAVPPDISVVVPTYGRPASLERCLYALAAQTLERDRYEVIVCDDGSEPPVSERLESPLAELACRATVRVVRQSNAGPAAARNRAAAEARGRFLAFTDDDCEPAPDWLARLLERLAERPVALVGGGIRNALSAEPYASATQAIMDFVYAERERAGAVRLFSTCNLAMDGEGFRAVGGFSPEFPDAAGEDYDFCWRWHEALRPAEYVPDALILHRHAMTLREYLRQHFSYGRGLMRVRRRRRARTSSSAGSSPGFLVRLVLHPLRHPLRGWRTALLIGVSQAATAAGAAVERIRPSRGVGVSGHRSA